MLPYPTLADFNQWVNVHIYDSVAELSGADYRADKGAFFGSVHATLNHLLLVDRLWCGRIRGTPLKGAKLTDILYDDFAALRAAREAEDVALIELIAGLSDEAMTTPITYTTTAGDPKTAEPWLILSTLFNHQTHHRGQVHCMLTQCGITPTDIDIMYYAWDKGLA